MEDSQLIDAALTQAFVKAPPYIQHYLWEGKFEVFMGELTKHFGLHADIAGKAENEILMTIIGMTPPNELAANLQNQAGVAPGLIQPILEELNKEVFVPLRESLEKAPVAAPAAPQQPIQPTPTEEKWIQVTPPQVAPIAAPVAVPIPAPQPIVPPAPVYVAPVVPPPAPVIPTPPAPVTAPVPQPAAPEYHEMMSMMRTMSKDIESLKGGVQPKMEPWKPVSVAVPPQTYHAEQRPPLPPQPAAPTYISPTTPPTIPTSAPQQHITTPIVHEHIVMPTRPGEDPYREPVE